MKLLAVLQCAYGKTEADRKSMEADRSKWLDALWESHTGRRLISMIPEGVKLHVANCSPRVGSSPSAAFPPDVEYITAEVERIGPDAILGCGKLAQRGLDAAGYKYIPAPHPAYRALSKATVAAIKLTIWDEGEGIRHGGRFYDPYLGRGE